GTRPGTSPNCYPSCYPLTPTRPWLTPSGIGCLMPSRPPWPRWSRLRRQGTSWHNPNGVADDRAILSPVRSWPRTQNPLAARSSETRRLGRLGREPLLCGPRTDQTLEASPPDRPRRIGRVRRRRGEPGTSLVPSAALGDCGHGSAARGIGPPGPYAADALCQAVADTLRLPFALMLERTEAKRWHGPHHSLRQAPFLCTFPEPVPTMILVVDDLITSGTTMKRSLGAIENAGVPAFGFAFSGC